MLMHVIKDKTVLNKDKQKFKASGHRKEGRGADHPARRQKRRGKSGR